MDNKNVFSELIRILFGSWYSIVGHTVVFLAILIVWGDLLIFTTLVSIEAIYISIFILMAEYKEEQYRNHLEDLRHKAENRLVREDVDLTQHVISEIAEIKEHQRMINEAFEKISKKLAS